MWAVRRGLSSPWLRPLHKVVANQASRALERRELETKGSFQGLDVMLIPLLARQRSKRDVDKLLLLFLVKSKVKSNLLLNLYA